MKRTLNTTVDAIGVIGTLGLFLFSTPSHASFVNLQKCGVENVGTSVFSHREICEGDTGSECVPFSGGYCESKEVIDEEVNDKPIYGERENILACATEQDCELLRPTHCAEIPESFFFYAMKANDGYEAYCTKIVGWTKVKTGKKLLVENPQKLAAHLQRLKDEKDAKEAAEQSKLQKCNAWKNANLDQATTIAQMRVMLKLKQDCDKE